jgi:hypothetical protein
VDSASRISQIDGVVEKATAKGRTGFAMALADQQRKIRAELVAQRTNEAKALAELQVEKVSIDGQRRVVEADMGPIRYLAILLGAADEDVLRWFILVAALLLDPAAVLLLLAATRTRSCAATACRGRGWAPTGPDGPQRGARRRPAAAEGESRRGEHDT